MPAENPAARLVFDYAGAFAALCIMEEIADPQLKDAGEPWNAYRELHGINQLRDAVLTRLAAACDAAWERAQARYEARISEHTDACEAGGGTGVCTCKASTVGDPGSFDYEFVPFWLRECVDWSDVDNGPRVRGATDAAG